ncbi:hypothetical protein [Ruegeria arenilitoris]|uniref:hypothetical protein n=1 Tax=Ruegeria arenilitoris TaxID=1173585 RepID=UPI00147C6A78|nr:hypothetical protein [Ruegeria arenilitoris]
MGQLDLWNGRRQKPVVAKRNPNTNPDGLTFAQQMIRAERLRAMREAEQLSNRDALMPHLRKPLHTEPDPAPVKAKKAQDTIFRPLKSEEPSPPVQKAPSAEEGSPVGKRKMRNGGVMKHHERPNHIEAEARKAETAKMTRAELRKRNTYTKKRKLKPGGK